MDDPNLQPRTHDGPTRRVVDQAELVAGRETLTATTERVGVATARLEKFLVTEQHVITIDVTREDVRLVHGPPPTGTGASTDDEAHPTSDTVVLYAEEVEIVRHWVPVETARLAVTTVTTTKTVTDTVRTEHIDATLEPVPYGTSRTTPT